MLDIPPEVISSGFGDREVLYLEGRFTIGGHTFTWKKAVDGFMFCPILLWIHHSLLVGILLDDRPLLRMTHNLEKVFTFEDYNIHLEGV